MSGLKSTHVSKRGPMYFLMFEVNFSLRNARQRRKSIKEHEMHMFTLFLLFFFIQDKSKTIQKIHIIPHDKTQKSNDLQYNLDNCAIIIPFVLYKTFTNKFYKRDKVLKREENEKKKQLEHLRTMASPVG